MHILRRVIKFDNNFKYAHGNFLSFNITIQLFNLMLKNNYSAIFKID